jgi:hypothetical protein
MIRQQKITLCEMRASGVRGPLIYCADFRCSHWIRINADQWSDETRLSDLEEKFTCTMCGGTVRMCDRIGIGIGVGGRCRRRDFNGLGVQDCLLKIF